MPASAFINGADMVAQINSVLDAVNVAGISFVPKLTSTGMTILNSLFVTMFSWNVLMFVLENNSKLMIDLTKLTVTWGILASLLLGWSAPIGGSAITSSISVSKFFLTAVSDDISAKIAPDPTPRVVEAYTNSMSEIFKVLSPTKSDLPTTMKRLAIGSLPGGSIFGAFFGAGDPEKQQNAADSAGFISVVISFFLLVLATGFIVWSLVTFVFVINAGTIMMYVGLTIGPILVPFLLVDRFSFLFDGWLRFMISSALYKIVAVIVGLLTVSTIDVIVGYAKSTQSSNDSLIFLSLMILFYTMLGKQFMGLADNIATSLGGGGSNLGRHDGGVVMMAISKSTAALKPSQSKQQQSSNQVPNPKMQKPAKN